MRANLLVFIALATVALAPAAFANSLDRLIMRASYDDCVLENMKGVTSDVAARAIVQACRNKFPSKDSAKSGKNDEKECHGPIYPKIMRTEWRDNIFKTGQNFVIYYKNSSDYILDRVWFYYMPKDKKDETCDEYVPYSSRQTNLYPNSNEIYEVINLNSVLNSEYFCYQLKAIGCKE